LLSGITTQVPWAVYLLGHADTLGPVAIDDCFPTTHIDTPYIKI